MMVAALALWCLTAWPADARDADGRPANPRTVIEWTFEREGDLEGWQPNGHLTDVSVTNGVLRLRARGSDPILELQPLLTLEASPWHVLELRLKADRDGVAEFFWSNTTEGRYGGFAQEKSTRFNVRGDGAWHDYRLMPFWHTERKIQRLRFDVYDGATFELDTLCVLELAMPPPAEHPKFDFTIANHGWHDADEIGGSFLLSPPLRFDAHRNPFVVLQLAVPGEKRRSRDALDTGSASAGPDERRATLFFATDTLPGVHRYTFPIEADGRDHLYNLDLLDAAAWRGQIIALGLRLPQTARALTALRRLEAGPEPQGPPQLKVSAFVTEEALPRAGRPVRLNALLANRGAATTTNLQATLTVAGASARSPTTRTVDRLGFDEETSLTWTIQADRPGTQTVSLRLVAANADPAQATLAIEFTPRPDVPSARYVPEPKPVRGPYEVGVYYFPGWKSASQWQPLASFPERRPVLGWYREGDPEVADWHIKWAVEHGITFFVYDWYWSQGVRQLEHALHDGYFQARYQDRIKFCLLWANHNPPGTSSHDDCLAVTRHWIEHYFRRPTHLTYAGKPVMLIFSPQRLTDDLGPGGVRKAFDAMRAECQCAGLNGLYLIACLSDVGQAGQAAAEGYDAVSAYTWPHLGMTGEGMYAPFETLAYGYRRQWLHFLEQSSLPLLPLPICGGWDSRPWHGENNLVRLGRTPALFQQHLTDARQILETRRYTTVAAKLLLIEAWNEWGEGSYIEPHQEFGFGYLDAVREVLAPGHSEHTDLVPADVGLGPYDLPAPDFKVAWEFGPGEETWSQTMDLADVKVASGLLTARTTGRDPAWFGPPLQARATDYRSLVLRMRLRREDGRPFADSAQLFWRTRRLLETEATSTRFDVIGDGQWHDYEIPVASTPRWRGIITRLRLDPCTQPAVEVAVDHLRLTPRR
jgi:hypothetical protein